jgi:hypothetical protein
MKRNIDINSPCRHLVVLLLLPSAGGGPRSTYMVRKLRDQGYFNFQSCDVGVRRNQTQRIVHGLHGNSISKIGCDCFWPGLLALPKNTLPIS